MRDDNGTFWAPLTVRKHDDNGNVIFVPGRSSPGPSSQGGGICFSDPEGTNVFAFYDTHYEIRGTRYDLDTLGIEDAGRIIRELRDWFKNQSMQ